MLVLDTPLASIEGIGPRFIARLKTLHIETVRDLLFHFPSRYEDFSQIYHIADLEPGQQATVQGMVEEIDMRRTWQKHLTIVEAKVTDETGTIRVVWFNQPYIKNVLLPGKLANFSGKVSLSDSDHDLYLSHPTYELVGREETRHTGRLVPIYPETRGLTSKGIRFLTQPILESVRGIIDWLPPEILDARRLPDLMTALKDIHFPKTMDEANAAKERFAFEDLFLLQLSNLIHKQKLAAEHAPAIPTDIAVIKKILGELPFELTHSQKQSLWEIVQDIGRTRPMNRLLQGDVGSGKTVVAALAAVLAARAGYETSIMAPTEVLAHQHFVTFQKLFRSVTAVDQPTIGLLTATGAKLFFATDREHAVTKSAMQKKIAAGEVAITIGTHALLQKPVTWKNLGLVIVDEQHRFGVTQRAALVKPKNRNAQHAAVPHFLSMSATPIPRTLMLTVFGDLDISTITELPAGRKTITTEVVPPVARTKAYDFIRKEIRSGRQAFVICPRIDPATPEERATAIMAEVKTVKEEYEKLAKTIFPDFRVGMLHGQLKPKEKAKVMDEFRRGTIDVLVSTSVIEVGVDVQNATIMMIEGADRFGLAQLYQFRGRVGRGEHESHCFLFTESNSGTTKERLKAIIEAKNGFELAERDLAIRGPGEFLGQKQTGLPDIAMANLQNVELIKGSRAAALALVSHHPNLNTYPLLRARLGEFRARLHLE